MTRADGTFTLTTYAAGDGAPEGGYQVLLLWPAEAKEGEEEPEPDRLLGWYDVARSKLTVRVRAGENDLPPFNLPPVLGPPEALQGGIPGRN